MSRLFLIAAAALLPISAHAQENSPRPTGLYVRGGAGAAWGETLAQDLTWNPALNGSLPWCPGSWGAPGIVCAAIVYAAPDGKVTDLGSGLALSAALGFQYSRTRTELEFRRMEASIQGVTFMNGSPPSSIINDDLVAQALMSNVYFDFTNRTAFTPYIGVGVGGARVENELGERDAAFAYQGRAGVELALGGRFSVGAEYVYFRTTDIVYGPKDKEFAPGGPPGPRTDGDPFVSSSAMGTVRVRF